MLNQINASKIDYLNKVKEFTKDNKSFSTYEISLALRKDGLYAEHSKENSSLVHSYMAQYNNYEKELHNNLYWVYKPKAQTVAVKVTPDIRKVDGRHQVCLPTFLVKKLACDTVYININSNKIEVSNNNIFAKAKGGTVDKYGNVRFKVPSNFAKYSCIFNKDRIEVYPE